MRIRFLFWKSDTVALQFMLPCCPLNPDEKSGPLPSGLGGTAGNNIRGCAMLEYTLYRHHANQPSIVAKY